MDRPEASLSAQASVLESGALQEGGRSLAPPALSIRHLSKRFARPDGGEYPALSDVSLDVAGGEFVAIVGPSGCGKSSLLTAIAGLDAGFDGDVELFGRPVDGVRPDVGLIFQKDALLPWHTAEDNVAMALRFRGVPRPLARRRAADWLGRVGLARFRDRYPHQLSGGMRKRVAIAATLVYEPRILLMDEPFSALDAQTRNLLENDILHLWSGSGQTVLFVTHDLEEAIGLSNRVVVLTASPGRVLDTFACPFGSSRNLLELRFDPAFTALLVRVWHTLEDEAVRAYRTET
jgi:NitT/TauT family transport system ATP-binding protein